MWSVQVKGTLPPGNGGYEISVVKEDNELGQTSWGWGGLDKIILFGSNLGRNPISPPTEDNSRFALWIADKLCAVLNERGEV